ncbi:spore germination lipoprotein GerD [Bacillaceae bacterium W0354]
MKKTSWIIFSLFITILFAGCSQGDSSQGNQDYEATKKMVVDILKTDDGKNAVKEVLSDEEMKQELVINSDVVQKAIQQVFDGDKGKQFFAKLFEDPSFVQSYVNATRDAEKELIKGLMTDSTYQEQMIQLFQNEDMQKLITSALKGQQFKSHLEETIQETLNSPLFKAKMTETLLKAAEEQQKQQGGGEQGGQGQQQGGQSGGGGSGSGGGGEQGGEG